MNAKSLRRALDGIIAGDFSDPTNERIIYLSAAGLALVGLALLVGTLVWWRRGRPEHPALAPLETMGTRAWAKAPEHERRRRLEHVRLHGPDAVVDEPVVRAEPVDLQALVRSVSQAFDDLREPGVATPLPAASEPVAEPAAAEELATASPDAAVEEIAEGPPVDEIEEPTDDVVEEPVEDRVEEIDATSISTPRPEEPTEALASGSAESSSSS